MEISKPKHPGEKAQFWAQEIAAQKISGQTIRKYCEKRGLSYHSLQYWQRIIGDKTKKRSELIAIPILQPKPDLPGIKIKFKDFEIEFSTMPDVDWLIEFADHYARGGKC